MNTSPAGTAVTPALVRAPVRLIVAGVAFLLGLGLFMTTGFAWPGVIHNATHDTRHSLGLPCH